MQNNKHYKQSQEILEEIKNAKKILVNLHRGPDCDSFSCAFSLYYFLCSLNKDVDVILTTNSKLSDEISIFEESKLVKFVDYAKFDFSKHDLFISPDSGSWQQVVDNREVKLPEIPIIVVDHHATNEKFGKINLIESEAASCAEMIYKLFEDWEFPVDRELANLLMVGIIADTGGFAFSDNFQALEIGAKLMKLGASKTEIIKKLFRTKKFEEMKVWGEFLVRFEIDHKNKFIWTALPYDVYSKYGKPAKVSSSVATQFASIVDDTNFGVVMIEKEKNVIDISFRARGDFDVSKLAEELGGGGHKSAAGGQVKGLEFEKAVEKVLEVARKYSEEN